MPLQPGLEDETVALAHAQGDAARYRRTRGARVGGRLARQRPFGMFTPRVAAAAAVALFFAGWIVRDITAGRPAFDVSNATVISFQAAPSQQAALAVTYEPGKTGAVLFGSGLQAPPSDQTYELWMFQDGTPRATCFEPQPDGKVIRSFHADFAASQQMAVTVESRSCPSAPTTQPILTADLTST